MSQSKQPAICKHCGLVGPRRPQAAKEGWLRLGTNTKPVWYCPTHGEEQLAARREAEYEPDLERLRRQRKTIPPSILGPIMAAAISGMGRHR